VAGSRRVDDDEVVVPLPHLPHRLADREDLPDTGTCGGDELEGARQWPDAGDGRETQLDTEVLLQRLLGVHRHGEEARLDLLGLVARGPGLEKVAEVALGVDLADERALAVLRGEQTERGCDRALADAALAADKQQPPIEETDAHAQTVTPWR